MNELIETTVIVLRKVPYSDNSLILNCLSPECGKLDFMVKGAKNIGKKKFPFIDLFKELSASFYLTKHELQHLSDCEEIANFTTLSLNRKAFVLATQIADFTINNSQKELPCHGVYHCLKNIYSYLATHGTNKLESIAFIAMLKLTLLDEHGLIPDQLAKDSDISDTKHRKLQQIISSGEKNDIKILPDISEQAWTQLLKWLDSLGKWHGLHF